MNYSVTASIVLYKENLADLFQTIECFLEIDAKKKLFLIDNTSSRFFEYVFNYNEIEYIAVESNIGFGAAHNIIIDRIRENSDYHLILNPDVSFTKETIPRLISELQKDEELAMIAPKVIFPNGNHQYSCWVRQFDFDDVEYSRCKSIKTTNKST